MMGRIASWSVEHRGAVVAGTLALAVVAGVAAARLQLDALPDVTTNQVLVLTRAPGLTPEEVERFVTRPVETAIGGSPGLIEQRSLSRYGISSVTAVFEDGVAPFLARQVIQERISVLAGSFPDGVGAPELGPLTGGLGEVFHFTLRSPRRTTSELLELATYRVSPLLRATPGVVEVNTWGGARRTLDVRADALQLAQRGLTLEDLRAGLMRATGTASGASVSAGSAQVLLRAVAWPQGAAELGAAIVRPAEGGRPAVRVGDVATVQPGELPRIGAATTDGGGECVYVMVQMLREANALQVVQGVHSRMDAVRAALPADVTLDVVYDRSVLVQATLRTVGKNLAEGGLLVIAVLLLMLGSVRAGLVVAATIPLSMLGALAGMVALGVPGNLMSLGAIDFGLLVDGAVVLVESVFHKLASHDGEGDDDLEGMTFADRVGEVARMVARPVFFSILIIVLVYVPVLSLSGVDGKMFRPMAITVVLALLTALVLSLTFIPAATALFLRPIDVPKHDPWLVRFVQRLYRPQLDLVTAHPVVVAIITASLLALGFGLFAISGTEFVPQLDEGDLVIQTTRAPDVSLSTGVEAAGGLERALLVVPEVKQVVSRIGSPTVATDIMGLEQADVFVTLRPRAEWRPGLTREALIDELKGRIPVLAGDEEAAFTQPIQMRFNELLGGSVTDVAVSVFGEELAGIATVAGQVERAIAGVPGAVDVRVLAPPPVGLMEVVPRPFDLARAGLAAADVLDVVQAVTAGIEVGATYDGPVRVPIQLKLARTPEVYSMASLPVALRTGSVVPLSSLADVTEKLSPGLVGRHEGQRRIVVGFNVRGVDLATTVEEARKRVGTAFKLPDGVRLEWGGQYETLQAAGRRLSIVIPAVLVLILLVLGLAFGKLRPALILFAHVPFACVGGVVALWGRGMPLSVSAAVGFIALSGIAVLNGVVLMTRLLELEARGLSAAEAAKEAALGRARPVLMTALVAALGFVPMMLASGVGAEVQRPLATVVVGGLATSTLLTLLILPTLYPWMSSRKNTRPVEQTAAS